MGRVFDNFLAALSEEQCLRKMMSLRFGDHVVCQACGYGGGFRPMTRTRACVCPSCGFAMYPCAGTPFEKLNTPLVHWAFAMHLRATSDRRLTAAGLQQETGWARQEAVRIVDGLTLLDGATGVTGRGAASPNTTAWSREIAAWLDGFPSFTAQDSADVLPKQGRTGGQHIGQVSPDAGASTRSRGERGRVYLIATGIVLSASAVMASAMAAYQWSTKDQLQASMPAVPLLTPSPRTPSITLMAVEEDLAAARAAVEFAEKHTPVLPEADEGATVASGGDPEEILQFGPMKVRRHIVETIVRAAKKVGADPVLLMAIADKESSFATGVKARTSSATGLFQFIERTWLGVVAQFGTRHGLDREAQMIKAGQARLDPRERADILEMRRDPYLSALLAAEMLKNDTVRMEQRLGRKLSGGEVYLIHFLGPSDAESFIRAATDDPDGTAASKFPRPAQANKSIFWSNKKALSVTDVHQKFEAMIVGRLKRYQDVKRVVNAGKS